jgi:hypothetical protein
VIIRCENTKWLYEVTAIFICVMSPLCNICTYSFLMAGIRKLSNKLCPCLVD